MAHEAVRAPSSAFFPYAASALTGLVVRLGLTIAAGGQEAVDTAEYLPIGVPLMAAAILAISYLFPTRAWRWTLSMAAGQMIAMLLTGSSLSAVADRNRRDAVLVDPAICHRLRRLVFGEAS